MRRLGTLLAFTLLHLLTGPARAQPLVGADVEQQWVDPAGRGSSLVGNGLTLNPLEFRVGAAGYFTHGNLRVGGVTLLQNRIGVQVFGAVGITNWLEVGALVPVFPYQSGATELATAGLGNPWLYGKVNLLDETHAIQAAAGLGLAIPVGTPLALGNGGLEVAPRLQIGKVYDVWQWGAELGFLYRPVSDYTPVSGRPADKVGNQVWLAGTATSISTSGPRGELSVRLHAPLTGGPVGAEAQLGVRWPLGDVELFASAGPGFGGAPSTPDVRAYLGIAFANAPMTQPPCVEGRPYVLANCPDLDLDLDGIKNSIDRAPAEPEDKDGFEDEDGAPDPDNDGDGVMDKDDQCPNVAGPQANHGCPDTDADHDTVVDRLDHCVNEPEDRDGFQDEDGCPDPDDDGDGILDPKDACPRERGIAQERGCPARDSDGDTVFDFEDNCPAEKGDPANAGCPVAHKQHVVISAGLLKPLEPLAFDAGKATLTRKSASALDDAALVMVAHAELVLQVEVRAETPALAQARADTLKATLLKKGVPESRLRAQTAEADAQGPRVELKLLTTP